MDKNGLKLVGGTNLTELEKTQIELDNCRSIIREASIMGYKELKDKYEALNNENGVYKGKAEAYKQQLDDVKVNIDKIVKSKVNETTKKIREDRDNYKEQVKSLTAKINGSLGGQISKAVVPLQNEIAYKDEKIAQITVDNKHKNEIIENQTKQIEMLKGIIEQITGVKGDTEHIIEMLNNGVKVDIDYDLLVQKIEEDGALQVFTKEQADSLIDIIERNKNYLIKCTSGKRLVKSDDDTIDKIKMVIDYINNGEKSNKDIANKYGITTNTMLKRLGTIKKSWYNVIKLYVSSGYVVTDGLIATFGEEFKDIVDILKELDIEQ